MRLRVTFPSPAGQIIAALILGLVLSGCSLSPNWPEVACSPDLDLGTVCVPGEDQRALTLFDGVASEADAAVARMSDPLAGVLDTKCFSLPPDVYTVCVSTEAGITVITPVVMPSGGRVSFEGDPDLDALDSVELSEPLGMRRENANFTVLVRDSEDKLLGTIGLGFYP